MLGVGSQPLLRGHATHGLKPVATQVFSEPGLHGRQCRTAARSAAAATAARQRLMAMLEHARGMVSVDTGPAHSAAAFDCPLVVIFGMEDPAEYEPRSPSGAVVALAGVVGGKRSMLGVQRDSVVEAWRGLSRRA